VGFIKDDRFITWQYFTVALTAESKIREEKMMVDYEDSGGGGFSS